MILNTLYRRKKPQIKKVEPIYECCFETKGAEGNNRDTIFVRGFDCSFTRDDIKSKLKKHSGSCGEIPRVFVPIECQTGSPIGFAFSNLIKDPEKALLLNGSDLGGLKLEVVMATDREEYVGYPNFKGCERCRMACHQRPFNIFYKTYGGRIHPRMPELDRLLAEEDSNEDFDEEYSDEDVDKEDGEEAIVTNHS